MAVEKLVGLLEQPVQRRGHSSWDEWSHVTEPGELIRSWWEPKVSHFAVRVEVRLVSEDCIEEQTTAVVAGAVGTNLRPLETKSYEREEINTALRKWQGKIRWHPQNQDCLE